MISRHLTMMTQAYATTDGDQAGEGEEGDDSTSEDDSDPEGDDDNKDELKLPEAYLRCAVHQGWEKEDALDFFKREPEHALKTFGNIYFQHEQT